MKKSVLRVVSLILVILSVFLTGCNMISEQKPETTQPVTENKPAVIDENSDQNLIYDCPVDFSQYRTVNREVYAYIQVPGTTIDYPIVQSGQDDNYYLRRTWKGESNYRGCIFTQSVNSKDFSDPVTVVYGHNTDKGDMFSPLLKLKDKDFFDKNQYFYIYTEEMILVYKVVSCFRFDTRHIMNTYDFNNNDVLDKFHSMLLKPDDLSANVRSETDLETDSRIVILSTCAEARSGADARFMVAGVLVNYLFTTE